MPSGQASCVALHLVIPAVPDDPATPSAGPGGTRLGRRRYRRRLLDSHVYRVTRIQPPAEKADQQDCDDDQRHRDDCQTGIVLPVRNDLLWIRHRLTLRSGPPHATGCCHAADRPPSAVGSYGRDTGAGSCPAHRMIAAFMRAFQPRMPAGRLFLPPDAVPLSLQLHPCRDLLRCIRARKCHSRC